MSLAFSLFFLPFLTKKWNFDQITPIHAQIGYTLNWYSALAFLRLSPSELLCSGCLPSDVFIFNWGVITPVCITARLGKKKKTPEREKEEDAPPRAASAAAAAASSAAACIFLLEGGGAPRCLLALVAIEDPSQPPYSAYFAIKWDVIPSSCEGKFTQRPSAEDCGVSTYWRLAGGSYTFVILCSGLQREWKRAYYANWVLFS